MSPSRVSLGVHASFKCKMHLDRLVGTQNCAFHANTAAAHVVPLAPSVFWLPFKPPSWRALVIWTSVALPVSTDDGLSTACTCRGEAKS